MDVAVGIAVAPEIAGAAEPVAAEVDGKIVAAAGHVVAAEPVAAEPVAADGLAVAAGLVGKVLAVAEKLSVRLDVAGVPGADVVALAGLEEGPPDAGLAVVGGRPAAFVGPAAAAAVDSAVELVAGLALHVWAWMGKYFA